MANFKIQEMSKRMFVYANKYIINNIPKIHSVYRNNFNDCLIQINENIFRANINQGTIRNKYQKEILVNISMIDMYLSIFLVLNIIEKKRFMAILGMVNEIKKMTMGWMDEKTK